MPGSETPRGAFVGIDLAGTGRGSESGVAVITEAAAGTTYHLPQGNWCGTAGLKSLADLAAGSAQSAVDQPFSYPRETTRLLLDEGGAIGDGEVAAYCSRKTDHAMRGVLRGLGLSSNYVLSPNRCQNVWRALALARRVGLTRTEVCLCQGKVIETHPRVAWSLLLSNMAHPLASCIKGYKGTDNPGAEAETRRRMLDLFEQATHILPQGGPGEQAETRGRVTSSADAIEALACAYVAYLHARRQTYLCGFPDGHADEEALRLEGAAVLPTHPFGTDRGGGHVAPPLGVPK